MKYWAADYRRWVDSLKQRREEAKRLLFDLNQKRDPKALMAELKRLDKEIEAGEKKLASQ